MIKRLTLFSILCICSITLHPTVCADKFFFEKHIILGVCKNHARGLSEATVYYKGVAKALNDYIALRIERGELKNKRFEVYMLDPILTRRHISLTQNQRAYFISTGEALGLNELMRLIDEFSQPGFTAIDLGIWKYEDEADYDRQNRQLDRVEKRLFGKKLLAEDTDFIKNKEYVIFDHNKLRIIYKNDEVKYFIEDNAIQIKPIGWPWIIRDRYIFQECGVLKVYEDTTLVKTFRYRDADGWECDYMDGEVYDKWINFNCNRGGYEGYSYSYDKNRFYYVGREDGF